MTPYVIVLRNGPTYSLDDRIDYHLRLLSTEFTGELWVTGTFEADTTIGRFDVHVRRVNIPIGLTGHLAYALRVVRRALRLRRSRRGQCVVVAYDPFRNGLIGTVVAWLLRSPLIVEVNGCIGDLEAYLDHRNSIVEAKRKQARLLRIGRFVLRRATAIRLLFRQQLDGAFTPAPGVVVRQAFDTIDATRFKNAGEERFILFVGFPFYLKGVDILIRAFVSIADQCSDWRLVLIGYGLVDEAAKVATHPRIEVLKPLPNWEIADWIGRCGILVLPSRSEAMGRVLLEAAAAGKARVASRVGGTYTVVADGEDGLLVEPQNVEALAAALLRLVRDSDLRRTFGAAAQRRFTTQFSGHAYVQRFQELVSAAAAAWGDRTAGH